ncbi:hypothetical protein [Falsirhodobacter halotolerans]|uniref:hypothetical protein n=1 Tax=Falsirhodobacter halotolerans TaxID=1146892 RepID=UPI001FD2042A|nr:hypothetical protein [Falsirhodobacter halotolerans]MCJ8139128.1 hypothetical protein [Falsirhodobacter halotolerans]
MTAVIVSAVAGRAVTRHSAVAEANRAHLELNVIVDPSCCVSGRRLHPSIGTGAPTAQGIFGVLGCFSHTAANTGGLGRDGAVFPAQANISGMGDHAQGRHSGNDNASGAAAERPFPFSS